MIKTKLKSITILMLGVTLVAPSIWGGVSRVGTASMKFEQGDFEIQFPENLKDYRVAEDEVVQFFTKPRTAPNVFRNPFSKPQTEVLELHPLENEYPELSNADSEEFRKYFESINWNSVKIDSNCLQVNAGESDTATYAVTSWGPGKGYLLIGPNTEGVKKSFKEIIESTKPSGGCQWK